jgi:hypothetical protein
MIAPGNPSWTIVLEKSRQFRASKSKNWYRDAAIAGPAGLNDSFLSPQV